MHRNQSLQIARTRWCCARECRTRSMVRPLKQVRLGTPSGESGGLIQAAFGMGLVGGVEFTWEPKCTLYLARIVRQALIFPPRE